jgi:serine/threonine protein kinase
VFRALCGPSHQPVALKVFTTGICAQHDWDARLQKSSAMLATAVHPHVVPIQRSGWWNGSPYLVLEYAPHGSLAARLINHRYSIREAVHLIEQLAEIVSYLHRQGVIHANLKPSNVLLAADGTARLSDFHLTGGFFQTPLLPSDMDTTGLCYLAPELIENRCSEPRPYTDIYGLGMTLYELLTGMQPFAGDSATVAQQVRSTDPIPPSRINPDVTPQLDVVCLRCLHKNPWRRYSRAYDVKRRLSHLRMNPDGRTIPGGTRSRRPPDHHA